MRINIWDLVRKAQRSTISNDEINEVIYRINNLTDKPNLEFYAIILGETGRVKYKKVLEKLLVYPENPIVSRAVLMILCQEWGLAEEYSSFIKEMIKGAPWDEDGDVRWIAFDVADDLFRRTKDKEFLKLLLEVFEDENEGMFDRGAAYASIARCVGVETRDLPSVGQLFHHLDDHIDQSIVARAHQLLKKTKN